MCSINHNPIRPRPSKPRTALKRICTIGCMGMIIIALFSIWISLQIGFHYGCVYARHGNVLLTWSTHDHGHFNQYDFGLNVGIETPPRFRLLLPNVDKIGVSISGATHYRWFVLVPFWLLLVVGGISLWLLRHCDRRIPAGHCQYCGYNLTGNVSGRCSECGVEVERA